jgi:hypothetical protein
VGFVVDKAALGQVFFEYFGSTRQSFHRFLDTHHPLSSGAGTILYLVVPEIVDSTPPLPRGGKKFSKI